ncbi:hypothetical protein A2699_01085 [Candidatus Gottesmanbacteria bacterium RIFCSPHIGHO2_01_FULL_43_15]|nr:MAG: hypothetical protein A2699_01085 [Candidatus Gottesmanbacteria bacterium RIFCSPHIGHO2_01_FULL_43_15]
METKLVIGKLFSILLIAAGLGFLLYAGLLFQERYQPKPLNFPKEAEIEHRPQVLTIDSLHLKLPIFLAEIKGSKWDDTDQGVSFLKTSTLPGHVGNSIIYGHNWPNLLGRLSQIRIGDTVVVGYDDGTSQNFKVKLIDTVTPDESYIVTQTTSDVRLTLYTCTGWFDRMRLVVTAVAEQELSFRPAS